MDLLARGRTRGEFEEFAAAHANGLLRVAFVMTGDRAEAEDLTQECLLRLARRWPHVRTMEYPGAYARKTLLNLVFNGTTRRARRRIELDAGESGSFEPETVPGVIDQMEIHDARSDLLAAVGALPPRQQAVLILRYLEDLPEARVAEILKCSVGTVKSTASRAVARLRETLEAIPSGNSNHYPYPQRTKE